MSAPRAAIHNDRAERLQRSLKPHTVTPDHVSEETIPLVVFSDQDTFTDSKNNLLCNVIEPSHRLHRIRLLFGLGEECKTELLLDALSVSILEGV